MKKYRCPWCGEAVIDLERKVFVGSNLRKGNSCPRCNRSYGQKYGTYAFQITAYLFIVVLGIIVSILQVLHVLAIMWICILLIILFAFVYNYFCAKLIRLDESGLPLMLDPNAKLVLNHEKRKIDNLDIYGVKFHKKTNAVRFHETFTDDLVPVVFHKNSKKQQGELEVTIMKIEFVPKDLLTEGAEFTVIDNGKELATGKITKVY